MSEIKEIWRDIPGYDGYYQVSDLGRVRSLDRYVVSTVGKKRFFKGGAINGHINKGYRCTSLSKNGKKRTCRFSQLVAMAFLGHVPNGNTLVVDHINGDRSNDRVENLRIVTNRANASTCFRSNESSFSSEHVGVAWTERRAKWRAYIKYKGAQINLGHYDSEIKASNAYQSALSKIKDGSFNPDNYKAKWTSEYKGVYYNKKEKKWIANIQAGGNQIYIGSFPTEELAYQARLIAEQEVKDGVFLANRRAKKNKVTPTS